MGGGGRAGNEYRFSCARRPAVPLGQLPSDYHRPVGGRVLRMRFLSMYFWQYSICCLCRPWMVVVSRLGYFQMDWQYRSLGWSHTDWRSSTVGLIFILPILGAQLGINLSVVSQFITSATYAVIRVILALTGNTYVRTQCWHSLDISAGKLPSYSIPSSGSIPMDSHMRNSPRTCTRWTPDFG